MKTISTLCEFSLLEPPYEPTKLKVVDSTKTSITLGWAKPEWDGGSEILSYVVEQLTDVEGLRRKPPKEESSESEGEEEEEEEADNGEWVVISQKGEVRTAEYVVSGLTPDVDYYFRVSAVNIAGRGEAIKMKEPVHAKDILGKLTHLMVSLHLH